MPTVELKNQENLFVATGEIPIVRKALEKHRKRRWWHYLLFWRRKKHIYKRHVPEKPRYEPLPYDVAQTLSARVVAEQRQTRKLVYPTTGEIGRIR